MARSSTLSSWILAGAILASPAAVLGLLLLSVAVAWHSRWFGIGTAGLVSAVIFIGLARGRNPALSKVFSTMGWSVGVFSATAFLISKFLSPSGESQPDASFRVVNIDSEGRPAPRLCHRWSPASLVAEVDQLSMGSALIPWLDPFIDAQKAQRIKALFGNVYLDMRTNSPEHIAVGSQLGAVYRDLAGWKFRDGHGYVYLPPRYKEDKEVTLPIFLFLHGSLGNFKGYMWVLREMADRNGWAIVAPSFGAGNWDQRGGTETLEQWLRYCENEKSLDHTEIVLAGISNGGRGITRLWAEMPERFYAIICISPVFEVEILEEAFASTPTPNEPLLIVHGGEDKRVPESSVSDAVTRLRKIGIQCDYELFPQEDHFLMFSQPTAVCERIEGWLKDWHSSE